MLASKSLNLREDDSHLLYESTKALVFCGTPHLGSAAGELKRVKLIKAIGAAAFVKVPKNVATALEQHSHELSDLADDFRHIGLYEDKQLDIYTYFETVTTAKLSSLVSSQRVQRLEG